MRDSRSRLRLPWCRAKSHSKPRESHRSRSRGHKQASPRRPPWPGGRRTDSHCLAPPAIREPSPQSRGLVCIHRGSTRGPKPSATCADFKAGEPPIELTTATLRQRTCASRHLLQRDQDGDECPARADSPQGFPDAGTQCLDSSVAFMAWPGVSDVVSRSPTARAPNRASTLQRRYRA